MDEEQIIIDGVDVSGCLFYQSNFEEDYDVRIKHFCSNWHNSCESANNSNCYFKQLARKTKECEDLKLILQQSKDNNKSTMLLLAEKNKECEELREDYKKLEQRCDELNIFYNEIYSIFPIDDECDITNEEHLLIIKELDKWNKDAFKCWEELNDILHGDYRYYGIDPEYIVDLVKKIRLRFSYKLREYRRYRKALEEIEDYCNDYCMDDCIGDERLRTFDKCQQCISGDILDIINKAKGEE